MKAKPQSKLLFVINPVSGGSDKIRIENQIHQYFEQLPVQIKLINLSGKQDDIFIKKNISLFQPDKVIAVGGDGTIKLIAGQLIGTKIPLGIIPAGSANGMALELNLPFSISKALDIVVNGIIKKIDLILFNDKEISVHISDLGLNAFLIKYYSMNRLRGKWGYAKAVINVLWQRRLLHAEILINGKTMFRKAWMIALANARSYGTGVMINPAGNLSDGKFEIVILKKVSVWKLLKRIFTNCPFDADEIELIQTNEVIITTARKVYFQIDGEYRGKVNTIKAVILPAALDLLLPAPPAYLTSSKNM